MNERPTPDDDDALTHPFSNLGGRRLPDHHCRKLPHRREHRARTCPFGERAVDVLSQEQIDDICLKSRETWDKQAAAKSQQLNSEKPLKRPLHQPILISKGSGESSRHRSNDRREHGSRRPYEDRRNADGSRR